MQINKLKFAKDFKNLLDIGFCEVEVKRSNVKAKRGQSVSVVR